MSNTPGGRAADRFAQRQLAKRDRRSVGAAMLAGAVALAVGWMVFAWGVDELRGNEDRTITPVVSTDADPGPPVVGEPGPPGPPGPQGKRGPRGDPGDCAKCIESPIPPQSAPAPAQPAPAPQAGPIQPVPAPQMLPPAPAPAPAAQAPEPNRQGGVVVVPPAAGNETGVGK